MKIVTFEVADDYIGLSTEEKPIEDVNDGSTLLEVDTGYSYIFYEGVWYKQQEILK